MNSQKQENILSLAMDSNREEREKSGILSVGVNEEEKRWEVIVKYHGALERIASEEIRVEILIAGYAIVTLPEDFLPALAELEEVEYIEKPKSLVYGLYEAKENSCLTPVSVPIGELSGKGVLLAVIDSGIDYYLEDFQNQNGSRILYLWDQTIQGNPPRGYNRGTEYTAEQINAALQVQTPEERRSLVPSEDISGHGTSVLGIGAGNGRGSGGRFRGVAYEADIIVVKLGTPGTSGFPRTTELMEGVDYCIRKAVELQMPVAVNLSFGNNYGAHNGNSLLELYLDSVAGVGKNVLCVGMGNEGTAGVHRAVTLTETEPVTVEFSIGEYQRSTNLQFWKSYEDQARIFLENPAGVVVGPIEELLGTQRFRLQDTDILIYYGEPTPYSVPQEIYIDFLPKDQYLQSGIWKIRIEPVRIVSNLADLWLPVSETASSRTRFLIPSVSGSFTVPAAAQNGISVAAYDSLSESYADFSGRAFNVLPWEGKPDLAAPGVDIHAPAVGGGYRSVTGTSFATPFVTGSAALLMEWGIIRGNDPYLFGNKVKAYLRRGARELPGFSEIPNNRVGYGALCVEDSLPE